MIQLLGRDRAETSDYGCPAGVTSTDWAFLLFCVQKNGRLANCGRLSFQPGNPPLTRSLPELATHRLRQPSGRWCVLF